MNSIAKGLLLIKLFSFFSLQTPVVVDPKSLTGGVDLLSVNDHLTNSEVCEVI